jgi:hypothetical protein
VAVEERQLVMVRRLLQIQARAAQMVLLNLKLLAAQGLDTAGISQSITTRFPARV